MKILGISCYYHDSSAALIVDGRVVSAAAEERFTRKKHDSSFPVRAINFCLADNGLSIDDIDYVAFYEKPILKFERFLKFSALGFPRTFLSFVASIPAWVKEKIFILRTIRKKLKYKGQVFFIDHHISHAASFFASPFKEAAILTVDGVGERTTASFGVGKGNKIKIKKEINFPHSLGLLYSAITAYLGFSVNDSEYKVMGLAAYGNQDKETNEFYKKIKEVIDVKNDGSFKLKMEFFTYQFGRTMCSKKMFELLEGKPRKENELVLEKHKDIASALQIITEEVLILMLKNLHNETKLDNLVFSGGVALNSVFNGKILKNTGFKNVWILPDPGDGGTSVGCAMYLYNDILEKPRADYLKSAYLGPEYSDDKIREFLIKNSVKFKEFDSQEEIAKETAKLIFDNSVVGWFQGKMEFGPRALGNRSILANPLNPKMQDILNLKVKHREQFRPFAPVVLTEEIDKFFECDEKFQETCNFMLMVYPIRQEWREKLPAVTHVDGSGRLQTANEKDNFLYYNLIKEFGKLSGASALVNTSFNVRGEPIVCTPEDAFKCMLGTEIDYLVMGKFLIKRSDNLGDFPVDNDTEKMEKKSIIINRTKRFFGGLFIVVGVLISQVLTGDFLPKLYFVKNHGVVFSAVEVFLTVLGGLLLFATELMTAENIGKAKKKIGIFLLTIGLVLNPVVIATYFVGNLQVKSLYFSVIFFSEIFIIILGIIFIIKPELLTVKKVLSKKKEILLVIVCLILTDFALSFVIPPNYQVRCDRGWCNVKGSTFKPIEDNPYATRKVVNKYFDNGFKRWGDLSAEKKMFIVGDSFTQDSFVNNGEEWYAYLERAFPEVSFFVAGTAGYGSPQEYMLFERYVDQIKPDFVLWQFCGNDYSDNYYPWDRMIYGRTNLNYRPYLQEDGKIVYKLAVPLFYLRKYSAISDKLFALYDKNLHQRAMRDPKIVKKVVPDDIQKKAFAITQEILQKVSAKAQGAEIYMFNACGPISEKEKKLCQEAGMKCVEKIQGNVEKQGTKDSPVHPLSDAHWSLKGNRLAGEELVNYFKKNYILH